ncbi:MAG: TIGR00730 family Rossman fold protein [Alphaproteobacteria bacterium]
MKPTKKTTKKLTTTKTTKNSSTKKQKSCTGKHHIKSVAVYCSHQFGNDRQYARDASQIGELLARNNIDIVFGGGDVGLMGEVATTALDNGGRVIGVSTEDLVNSQEPVHGRIKVEIVSGLNVRKQRMYEMADAFIILPGGIGTLNEVTDILTMQQIGESKKPIFFLNSCHFWDLFSLQFVHMIHNGFIENAKDFSANMFAHPDELIKKILEYNN